MKKKYWGVLVLSVFCIMGVRLLLYSPMVYGDWNKLSKQTLYLWMLDSWHVQAKDATPKFLLIDDDSGSGVFILKNICDDLGVKAIFAVIPNRLDKIICDSLVVWQKEGYGIALHGYNHDRWSEWSYEQVVTDIVNSERCLAESGIAINNEIMYVVPPYGCNTKNIRMAVANKGYKMVSGAALVNPDTSVFLLGRIFINNSTDMTKICKLLKRAKENNSFVIFGTHSSNKEEFSVKKTKEVLQMALDMGYNS